MQILIVDDHPVVRAGLRRLLADEGGCEIREATDASEALRLFRAQRPALVVLDLNLPGLGGLETIARLRTADPEARILVLSMHDDPVHVTRALRAGAAGYVSKGAAPEEIVTAVRRVASGRTYLEHGIAEELALSNLREHSPLQDLSARDLEILRLLASGRKLPQIADVLGISYKTAANNCSRIKGQVGASGTADLIRIAIRAGLIDCDADLAANLPSSLEDALTPVCPDPSFRPSTIEPRKTAMEWKTPVITEIAVGCEINAYACAEIV
jgi:coenzyme PQQ precursor peptide PqqA